MRIGVFTSGGDAPGMNACVRAVVRSALAQGHEVVGIRRGYAGLLERDFHRGMRTESDGRDPETPLLTARSVSNVLQHGGTMLRTSRSQRFMTDEGQREAAAILSEHGIDVLVPIGGDGTFRGAVALARCWDGRIIGCPGTIDNDLSGTDYTIGFDTAVNTAVEAIDKIRDTADATERMFLIEVMGRHSGYIALDSALAAGAEEALMPETPTDVDALVKRLVAGKERGKTSSMVIVAEGDPCGGAEALHQAIKARQCPYETRVLILGHLQRGGSPTVRDRILASRLGAFAVDALVAGETGMMAGEVAGEVVLTPFEKTWSEHKPITPDWIRLLEILAR
jgi:6-phosphofructokinase 1